MEYRNAQTHEFDMFANIHIKSFNDFFLSTLGKDFLRTYYKAVLQFEESIAVCAINTQGKLVGFATGSMQATGYNRRLLSANCRGFLLVALKLIFTKPKAIIRLLKNLTKQANPADDGNYAELLSIAVLPTEKGNGVGKGLLNYFEAEAMKRGCTKVALTTDFENNDGVVAFYRKNGYGVFYEFITYPNRKMYKLIKQLPEMG